MHQHPASANRDVYFACFNDVHGVGGALTVADALAEVSRSRRLATLLLGSHARGDSITDLAPEQDRINVGVPAPAFSWRFRSWQLPRQLERHLRCLPPPRLAFVGQSPYWIAAAKRVWPALPTAFVFPCLLANCLPFTWPGRRPPTFWTRVDFAGVRRAEHLAFTLADRIIAPTQQARQEILAFHPQARDRVYVCPWGGTPHTIDTELRARQRRSLGLPADAFAALAVGVCDRNKAFDWGIREMPAVDQRGHLLVIGDGPEREHLIELAAELGVSQRVHVLGLQPNVDPWYAAADCVVSTSRYDTFPNVIVAGLCRGQPAVVPRHAPPNVYAGMAEVIRSGGGGVVYDRTRRGGLAARLNELIRNPVLCETMGVQARAAAAPKFRWDVLLDHVLGTPAETGAQTPSAASPIRSQPAALSGGRTRCLTGRAHETSSAAQPSQSTVAATTAIPCDQGK